LVLGIVFSRALIVEVNTADGDKRSRQTTNAGPVKHSIELIIRSLSPATFGRNLEMLELGERHKTSKIQ